MTMNTIDVAYQRHGAAQIPARHLFHTCLLPFLRVNMFYLPYLSRSSFKSVEDLVLGDGRGVDVQLSVCRLVWQKQSVLDG